MPNPLLGKQSKEQEEADRYVDDQQQQQQPGPFGYQQYNSSYSVAAHSWQLRKNLTETFNKHVHDNNNNHEKKEDEFLKTLQQGKDEGRKPVMKHGSHQSSFVLNKIARYEQSSTGNDNKYSSTSQSGRNPILRTLSESSGKPPRQPSLPSISNFSKNGSKSNLHDDNKNKINVKNCNNSSSISPKEGKRCVSVYVRVRPPKEGSINTIEILHKTKNDKEHNKIPPTKIRTHAPHRSNAAKMNRDNNQTMSSSDHEQPIVIQEFDFQQAFGPDQSTEDVYETVVAPMVDGMFPQRGDATTIDGNSSVQKPESGLLLAYGATNAGKTYSILGKLPTEKQKLADIEQKHFGIVPRAIQGILNNIEKSKLKLPDQSLDLYLSYFEIYNDNIYDLLEDQKGPNNPFFIREPLKLREHHKKTFLKGLKKQPINSVEEGIKLARQANSQRQTSNNNLNSGSSRSHCICQLQVVQRQNNDNVVASAAAGTTSSCGYSTDEDVSQISKQLPTTLWIVDLAGKERSKRTNVGALRQKEASSINKGLMNLMRCLSIMRENQSAANPNQVIPFRDNKLTHLFMPVFTGSASSIAMIVCVNPAAADFDETSHVLSYASKAKMVLIEEDKTKLDNKTSQTSKTCEYGYNGRPIINQQQQSSCQTKQSKTSKLASFVKKLSPKKLMKRAGNSSDKDNNGKILGRLQDRKRKALPSLNSSSSLTSVTSEVHQGSVSKKKTKRMRVVNPIAGAFEQATKNLSAATAEKTDTSSEVKSLKMKVAVMKAEIQLLQGEKAAMEQEMEEIEQNIRVEIAGEMEQQLETQKRYYMDIIDKMKSQARQSLGAFEKRVRVEQANQKLDVLLEKLEEAEDELRREYATKEEAEKEYKESLAAKDEAIKLLKAQLELPNNGNAVGGHSDTSESYVVKAQLRKIKEQELQLESKNQIIEELENLLRDCDQEEEDDVEDEDSPSDEEEENEDNSMEDYNEEAEDETEDENKFQTFKPKNTTKHNKNLKKVRAPLSALSNY